MTLTERDIAAIKCDDVEYFRKYFMRNKSSPPSFQNLLFEHRAYGILYLRSKYSLGNSLERLRNKPHLRRILLESIIRSGDNPRKKFKEIINRVTVGEIQYLLTRGFIKIGNYDLNCDLTSSYLHYTMGSTCYLPFKDDLLKDSEEIFSFHHCLTVEPSMIFDKVEQLSKKDCDRMVMYDNFDDRRLRNWIGMIRASNQMTVIGTLCRVDSLEPWLIYRMITNEIDRDQVFLSLIIEGKMDLVEMLAKRRICFSHEMEQKLSVAKNKE